jgi:Chitinase
MITNENVLKSQIEQPEEKSIIGYYAAWTANSGFTPSQIDATRLTHINYAFANIGTDLKIQLGYPELDPFNFNELNGLKLINPNLKTLISVGGWTWSGLFSEVALTDVSRAAFSDSCVAFILRYGFDGVDIDWEYPVSGGLPTNTRRPEDKRNFTLLLQSLREALDAQGAADGKHYLLSIAGGSGGFYAANTELALIHQYLDYACIMTYDIYGTWDSFTDFNAPLYISNDITNHFKWSVAAAVETWYRAGYPLDKLMMGIPFYGYIYGAVNNFNYGLYQPFNGANSILYSQVTSNYLDHPGYIRYFHPEAKVPWLFNGTIFISYDDPESIWYKTEYIKANNMAGAMIWELSGDPSRVLQYYIYNELR